MFSISIWRLGMKKGELDTKLNRYKARPLSLGDAFEAMVPT